MAENWNNHNPNNNNGSEMNNSGQGQPPKAPEYNFWAEQMPNNPYSYYNPNTNSWDYSHSAVSKESLAVNDRKAGKGKRAWLFILKALCFGILAAIGFFLMQKIYYVVNPTAEQNNWSVNNVGISLSSKKPYVIKETTGGSVETKPRSVISDVTDKAMPSIVSIRSLATETTYWFGQRFDQPLEGSGSGIIVGENDNEILIATNNHVVAGASEIVVTYIDGTESAAIIKGTDAIADLAVITVDISDLTEDTLSQIKVAKIGNSDDVKVGEMSIAIGNALGYGQSVTVGYVSAKDREVQVSDGYNTKTMVLLQTDAAINPGNSGGALLNTDGEVIGINTVKYASNDVEGMGYAIPMSRAIPIINELMSREVLKEADQGYLGIGGYDVTEDVSQTFNIPIGVFVKMVDENGAAHAAGILPNDIITVIDELEVTSITQLSDYVKSKRVGSEVKVTYMRSINGTYEKNEVTLELGSRPKVDNEVE
ncbi:MAG TPA: PDZ domain-containing protein [Clostridiales bacterium]|nr:PDZ domain-containing protein [Clostridiales bacterium]